MGLQTIDTANREVARSPGQQIGRIEKVVGQQWLSSKLPAAQAQAIGASWPIICVTNHQHAFREGGALPAACKSMPFYNGFEPGGSSRCLEC